MYPSSIKLPCDKSIVEICRERAYFVYYKDRVLTYKTESGFVIRIPIEECGTATYNFEEPKALVLLRWLRPQYGAAIKELNGTKVAPNPEVKLLTAGNPLDLPPLPVYDPSKPDGFRGEHSIFD